MPTPQYLIGWVIFCKEPMKKIPTYAHTAIKKSFAFRCYMMNIEWLREGVVIVKEGVVTLNDVGIRFHVFRLLLKIAEIAKTLK